VVQRDDGSACVKILDFGFAKDVRGEPQTTAAIGTRSYMPPEQLRGEHPDARTDTAALGHIAFTLLTSF
jgi:serine/threonine-protein kinase